MLSGIASLSVSLANVAKGRSDQKKLPSISPSSFRVVRSRTEHRPVSGQPMRKIFATIGEQTGAQGQIGLQNHSEAAVSIQGDEADSWQRSTSPQAPSLSAVWCLHEASRQQKTA
jgi:hypothetical protein